MADKRRAIQRGTRPPDLDEWSRAAQVSWWGQQGKSRIVEAIGAETGFRPANSDRLSMMELACCALVLSDEPVALPSGRDRLELLELVAELAAIDLDRERSNPRRLDSWEAAALLTALESRDGAGGGAT